MKILHTADWHIGHRLCKRDRMVEIEAFLDWLVSVIASEQIDVLLVAGDLFDTCAPTTRGQELYYHFLWKVARSPCRHVVITGGNHDSPSFLNAPKDLLRHLDVHVVASARESPGEEVIVLMSPSGQAELIVCAVPYLRDRDIRLAEAGETLEEKDRKLVAGIHAHYEAVFAVARQRRAEWDYWVPLVAMGHLFAAGGHAGDGTRDLYIGTLGQVSGDVFPKDLDYVALGHLHHPQTIAGNVTRRYSGAPLAMGFSEGSAQKSVCQVVLSEGKSAEVTCLPIPKYRELESVQGTLDEILIALQRLKEREIPIWVEVIHTGKEIVGNLVDLVHEAVEGSAVELLRVKHRELTAAPLASRQAGETLDDLDLYEVFARYLDVHEIAAEKRDELVSTYRELVSSYHQEGEL